MDKTKQMKQQLNKKNEGTNKKTKKKKMKKHNAQKKKTNTNKNKNAEEGTHHTEDKESHS